MGGRTKLKEHSTTYVLLTFGRHQFSQALHLSSGNLLALYCVLFCVFHECGWRCKDGAHTSVLVLLMRVEHIKTISSNALFDIFPRILAPRRVWRIYPSFIPWYCTNTLCGITLEAVYGVETSQSRLISTSFTSDMSLSCYGTLAFYDVCFQWSYKSVWDYVTWTLCLLAGHVPQLSLTAFRFYDS